MLIEQGTSVIGLYGISNSMCTFQFTLFDIILNSWYSVSLIIGGGDAHDQHVFSVFDHQVTHVEKDNFE
jgi:hypothetical protein